MCRLDWDRSSLAAVPDVENDAGTTGDDVQDAVGAADGQRVLDGGGMASLSRTCRHERESYTTCVEHPGHAVVVT